MEIEVRLTVATGEEGLAGEHLGEDASNGPDIDGLCVFLERQHDLGCSVPAGRHILCHESAVFVVRVGRPRQTKIANLFQVIVHVHIVSH